MGTSRKAIIIECKGNVYFVGPDNGLFIPAAKRLEIKGIYELKIPKNASPVFHGRDVFAPAAAKLSAGKKAKEIGKKIDSYVDLDFGEASIEEGKITGKILFIDRFGNIITNIEGKNIQQENFHVKIGLVEQKVRLYPSYGYAKKGEILATIGSSGFLEIARREGDASKYFSAKQDMKIEIFF